MVMLTQAQIVIHPYMFNVIIQTPNHRTIIWKNFYEKKKADSLTGRLVYMFFILEMLNYLQLT